MSRKSFSPYQCIYSRANITDGSRRFFPSAAPAKNGADVKYVHCQADVLNSTADVYIQFAFQETDDLENWPAGDTFTAIGATTITADGISANTGFDSITVTKAFVRFGVAIRNNNDNPAGYEFAWVSTRFDTRSC